MARVPYVDQDDLPAEYRDLIVSSLQPGKTVNVYSAIGNNPAVLDGLRSFLGQLWSDTSLGPYQRELVILAVARAIDSEYEWHQHVGIARGEGVTDDEIIALSDHRIDAFDAPDAALLRYALAVVDGTVTNDDHAAIAAEYDDPAIVGATALAAGYTMLASLINALGVEIEAGDEFVGWRLENA